jgi:hypothetical protein
LQQARAGLEACGERDRGDLAREGGTILSWWSPSSSERGPSPPDSGSLNQPVAPASRRGQGEVSSRKILEQHGASWARLPHGVERGKHERAHRTRGGGQCARSVESPWMRCGSEENKMGNGCARENVGGSHLLWWSVSYHSRDAWPARRTMKRFDPPGDHQLFPIF